MSSAEMWWGSSDIPSGCPETVRPSRQGACVRLYGTVDGPGCGRFSCREEWRNLTFVSRFFLDVGRMPASGVSFRSAPKVHLDGLLWGETVGGALFDKPSAVCGLRLRQYVYAGGTCLGVTETANPKLIDIRDKTNGWQGAELWGPHALPRFSWTLDRTKALEIDVEVRFRTYLEGTGLVRFDPYVGWPLVIDVPQWRIESVADEEPGPEADDLPEPHTGSGHIRTHPL
jgi:hypothetical protein